MKIYRAGKTKLLKSTFIVVSVKNGTAITATKSLYAANGGES